MIFATALTTIALIVPFGILGPAALAAAIEAALDHPVDRPHLIAGALNYIADLADDSFLEIVSDL